MIKSTLVKALFAAAVASAMTVPAGAQNMNTPAASSLNKTDLQIVASMARANMAEIEAGKLALANGQSAEVKTYAQQMVDDHTKALADVTTLAQNKGVTLPTEPDAKHKAMAAKLSKLKGEKFDQMYMQQAGMADHKQVHAMLKKDEARAKDPDVKALAAKMLPTVAQHLAAAGDKAHAGHTTK
jgi:putative membrane protein